ncbi:hypothetical protein Asi03nite_10210 [Actinoplanes siamensis]|uniref:Uncharacterized protein n=1 Tax=Actinoplanes siamensis TaxID=1223317 RepID=A0A919KCW3_9ACTN|nr:hypothetical protein Asi03nite_10210 [Actinoplanes siamensis]
MITLGRDSGRRETVCPQTRRGLLQRQRATTGVTGSIPVAPHEAEQFARPGDCGERVVGQRGKQFVRCGDCGERVARQLGKHFARRRHRGAPVRVAGLASDLVRDSDPHRACGRAVGDQTGSEGHPR